MVTALGLLAACAREAGPVTIAAVGAWDGVEERSLREGIEQAAAEVNGEGGIGGRELRVVFHEDRNDPALAARIAAELVADAGVAAVIGHTRSDPTLVAARAYDGHLPVVTARLTSGELAGLSPWVFQLVPSDSAFGAAAARFAAARGWRRASVLFNNTARGRTTAAHFRAAYAGEIVSQDPATFPVAPVGDMQVFVAYHRTRQPDVVFAPIGEPRHAEYSREAQTQRLRAAVIGWDVWASLASDAALPGEFYYVAPFDLRAERPETRGFVERFTQAAGHAPGPFAALGYDAVRLLAHAARQGGAQRAGIRDALAALSPRAPYAAVIGPVAFTAEGMVTGPQPVIVPLPARAGAAAGEVAP